MRAVIQRITQGSVQVNQHLIADQNSPGLLIFLGIGTKDNEEIAIQLARKISNLRIFSDENGKMNLSIRDIQGKSIVVSQFTLFADTKRGNRPSFIEAGDPEKANFLVNFFANYLESLGVPTQQGEFAADMQVSLTNDGPVTIWIEI
jgi:D-tyrosyl-tRNA(Tyr) deacylase